MKIISYTDAIVKFAFAEAEVYYRNAPMFKGLPYDWTPVPDKSVFERGGRGYEFAIKERNK